MTALAAKLEVGRGFGKIEREEPVRMPFLWIIIFLLACEQSLRNVCVCSLHRVPSSRLVSRTPAASAFCKATARPTRSVSLSAFSRPLFWRAVLILNQELMLLDSAVRRDFAAGACEKQGLGSWQRARRYADRTGLNAGVFPRVTASSVVIANGDCSFVSTRSTRNHASARQSVRRSHSW